jgi:anti-sigma factor RsiW
VTCRDFADFLADYLDDALPAAIRREFEAHLAECPDCVAYLQQYRDVIRLTALAADDLASVVMSSVSRTGSAAMPEELVRAIVLARHG